MPPVDRAAAAALRATHVNFGLGMLLAGFVLILFGAVALSTDVPRTALGFKSDEASYYMLGHSLAEDLDMTYRREDLARVWHEFPSGPLGVFLKKGRRDPHLVLNGAFPFVRLVSAPDTDGTRLYYGKSYIYPLFAAPFVMVWGTNGFLVFHALLLALAVFAAYLFLNARGGAVASALIATAYVLASVASGYFVWMTPELFNFTVVTLGVFCWAYKLVAPEALPPGLRWLRTGKSDAVAAILLACATFSKPPNALFILPVLAWSLSRRRWAHAVGIGVLFGTLVVALFGINTAITGDWNYQGGERNTFYRDFPFLDADSGFRRRHDTRDRSRADGSHLRLVAESRLRARLRVSDRARAQPRVVLDGPPLGRRAVFLPGGLRAGVLPLAACASRVVAVDGVRRRD